MEQPLIENKSHAAEAKKVKNPGSEKNKRIIRKLLCVSVLALVFMGLEVAGGLIAGSIAILSDAAHMLSDLLGFAISIVSVYISGLPATKKYSFGFHRAGVIGAMTSVIVIWILSGFLIYYAIQRIIHIDQVEVEGFVMFLVSCFGLVTNIIMVSILHGGEEGHSHDHGDGGHSHGSHGGHSHSHDHKKKKNSTKDDHDHDHDHGHEHHHHNEDNSPSSHKEQAQQVAISVSQQTEQIEELEKSPREPTGRNTIYIFGSKSSNEPVKHDDKEDLNVKATMIHILGDILQSIGVIISSALIWMWPEKFKIADPIITLVFALIVLFTTLKIVGTCMYILMEGTPKDIDHKELEKRLREVEGVVGIHDIHIWCLNIKKNALAMHARVKGDPELITLKMKKICREYNILHTTIQTEMVKELEEKNFEDCEQDVHILIEHQHQ